MPSRFDGRAQAAALAGTLSPALTLSLSSPWRPARPRAGFKFDSTESPPPPAAAQSRWPAGGPRRPGAAGT